MERLIIKNFGPIREADLTFRRFNVLIGEQATGKSTVVKLLAVCRNFSYILPYKHYPHDPFEEGLIAWGLDDFIQWDKTSIVYENEHYKFSADHIFNEDIDAKSGEKYGEYIGFGIKLNAKSEAFAHLLSELNRIIPTKKGNVISTRELTWRVPTSFLENEVAAVIDTPFYLPAERGLQSIFSLGKSSVQNISDALFQQLAEIDQVARQFSREVDITPLGIIYRNDNGRGYFKKKGSESFYSMFKAATGYQSTMSVILTLVHYSDDRREVKTFIIEEPELNLFPNAQDQLMRFLVDKTMNYGNTSLIATYSPYVLSSLNMMMSAYRAGQIDPAAANKELDSKFWLNPDEVAAYKMSPAGTCMDLVDREEGLIHSEEIDTVSNELNERFDAMLAIQFHQNESGS